MNPGTTILILLGIIGLLLYASKALSVSKTEGFSPVDESQISTVGSTALNSLMEGTNGLNVLLSAFGTPDIDGPPPIAGGPSLSEITTGTQPPPLPPKAADTLAPPVEKVPAPLPPAPEVSAALPPPAAALPPLAAEVPIAQPAVPSPTPVLSTATLPTTALPVNAPPSVLGAGQSLPSPTTSDLQGTGLMTATQPIAAPAPMVATPLEVNMPVNTPPAVNQTLSDVQGTSLMKAKALTCPPMPDMSQYVRKDQIPCWGCNLK